MLKIGDSTLFAKKKKKKLSPGWGGGEVTVKILSIKFGFVWRLFYFILFYSRMNLAAV